MLRFLVFLVLFFLFLAFLDVRVVDLMVDDVVNQLRTVTVLVVDAHFGCDNLEVFRRLLVEFKDIIHKRWIYSFPWEHKS